MLYLLWVSTIYLEFERSGLDIFWEVLYQIMFRTTHMINFISYEITVSAQYLQID